jgi:hypothetical protein
VTAATLAVVALAAIAWAIGHHIASRGLRTRKAWARNLALALAAFNLLLLPLGTALGLYTLWVLLHEQVRAEFHA